MQAVFTCGIWKGEKNNIGWRVFLSDNFVGFIDDEYNLIEFNSKLPPLTPDSLIELCVVMNNIKRQYNNY